MSDTDDLNEPMTDAELRIVREHLGLSQRDLAALLGVDHRTILRWEAGTHRIPNGARLDVEALEDEAGRFADDVVTALRDDPDPAEATLLVWRTDEDYWAAHPEQRPRPAAWHRAIVARVLDEVPGLTVTYAPPAPFVSPAAAWAAAHLR